MLYTQTTRSTDIVAAKVLVRDGEVEWEAARRSCDTMEDGEQHLVRFPLRRTFVPRPSLSAAPNRPAFKHTLALIVPA